MRLIGVAATVLLLWAAPAEASVRDYAHDTWASFEAMTDARSGLPADILNADGSTSVQTSTTNIGAYLWSAVAARRLGFITRRGLVRRVTRTISTLERMERFGSTGQFYNWYDHRTGAKLTFWPPHPADEFHPILSSVDHGWLAVGLKIVSRAVGGSVGARARRLFDAMDWG